MMSRTDLYGKIRKAVREAGGQSKWAAAIGVTPSYVSDVLSARCDPGPAILAAMRVRKVVAYEALPQ